MISSIIGLVLGLAMSLLGAAYLVDFKGFGRKYDAAIEDLVPGGASYRSYLRRTGGAEKIRHRIPSTVTAAVIAALGLGLLVSQIASLAS